MPPAAAASDGAPRTTQPASATLVDIQNSSENHHIWLVTGPAGCGKSTVAKHLAETLTLPYIEGDEPLKYHPPANIEKMSNGIPLTDADRWDWLTALREESVRRTRGSSAEPGSPRGVVVTCSALKRKYRDVIRVAPYFAPNLHLHFLFLSAPEEVLVARVLARKGHYMGAGMVHSQFEVLEPPTPDEFDVIPIDVQQPAEEVKTAALSRVREMMERVAGAGAVPVDGVDITSGTRGA